MFLLGIFVMVFRCFRCVFAWVIFEFVGESLLRFVSVRVKGMGLDVWLEVW